MSDDPFSLDDDDKTILRPGNFQPGLAAQAKGSTAENWSQSLDIPELNGINPLEQAASKLLALLVTMRNSHHPAPDQLRNQLIRSLETFRDQARDILGDRKQATQASYIMCTALDEAAMNTPWGHQADWSQHNLLSTFHNEVVGGERFFTLLKGLGKDAASNIQLLELMYVCLSLGYQGNYRIVSNGQETLQKVRTWLYEIIQTHRTVPSYALSAHWQGVSIAQSRLPRMTPLWVSLAAAVALASIVYVSLLFNLGNRSEQIISSFSSFKAEPLNVLTIEPPDLPPVPEHLTLSEQLATQIQQGQLAVIESFDHGVVRLVGDSLFKSGSAQVNATAHPLITQTAEVINQYRGAILVSGYSDNIPIRSARYPSNLALSKARALSVSEILLNKLAQGERLAFEGRGSDEPIGDNATASGRRTNRRVEVTVYY